MRAFAGTQARIAFLDIDADAGEALAREVAGECGTAPLFVPCDLLDIEREVLGAAACLTFVVLRLERILELAVKRSEINLKGQHKLRLGVALWHGGLPVDVLPAEGFLEIPLGEESSWPIENS